MSKIDPRASIAPTARLGNCVSIDAFAVIGDEVELGEGCIVESPAARSVIGGSGVPILQVEQ